MIEFDLEAFVAIGLLLAVLLAAVFAFTKTAESRTKRRSQELAVEIPGLPSSPAKAAAELQALPPRLVVRFSAWPIVGLFTAVSLVLFLIAASNQFGLWGWVAAIVSVGVFAAMFIRQLGSGKPQLILGREGFEYRSAHGDPSFHWRDVEGHFGEFQVGDQTGIGFDLKAGSEKRSGWLGSSRYDVMWSEVFQMKRADLLRALNRRLALWRIANGEHERAGA